MEQYARYRAPAESGQKLVSPSWSELPSLVAAGKAWRNSSDLHIAGQPLPEFAAESRREVLAAATEYVASYAPGALAKKAASGEAPLILTGHQPELIHPGVWVKNFAAAHLAASLGGVALNLVIDADACRTTAIRVPAGAIEHPAFGLVEFDHPAPTVPWEERRILDHDVWQSFPDRVRQDSSPWIHQPMLDTWWPQATERGEATGRIGMAIAQGRHLAELEWGQKSLELPQSRMCQTRAFRRFACAILAELPRFVFAYNGALDEYRHKHHIRNHAHPVSNLATSGPWLQTPFWVWSAADANRRAVYVRQAASGLIIADRQGFERVLPLAAGGGVDAAITELEKCEAEGIKLRSRALVTTMFTRIALADLFIHGIGGAKYDEATDSIIRRFFHTTAPPFATISGTLRLPLNLPEAEAPNVIELRRSLRELEYHPERSLAGDVPFESRDRVTELVAEKRRWLATAKSARNGRERHVGITAANQALQPFVGRHRAAVEAQLAQASEQARAARVLRSREYAFCLFPRNMLGRFLLDFQTPVL